MKNSETDDGKASNTGKNPTLKIIDHIKNVDTRVLFVAPAFLGMLLSVLWSLLAKKINAPANTIYMTGIFSFFMIGLGGLGIIIKKEFPSTAFLSIRGLPALIIGILWILFWWGLAFAGIWRIFLDAT